MRKVLVCLGAVAVLQIPNRSEAQAFLDPTIPFNIDRGGNVSVADRPHPQYDAIGIPAGSFLVFPKLSAGVGYTSNVFGSTNNPTSDAYFATIPTVKVQSQWSKNLVQFDGTGSFKRYADQTIRNENGYHFDAIGRLDVLDQSSVTGSLGIVKTYENQESGTFPISAVGLVPYVQKTASLLGIYTTGRVRFSVASDINDYNFSNTTGLGGAALNEDFRDHDIVRGSGRAEFALSPSTAAFVQVTYQTSNYHNRSLPGGDRNSQEVRTLAGFTFDLTAVVRSSIGFGYVHRTYSNPLYKDYGDIAADVRIEYFLSQLTTISLTGRRLIQDATLAQSSSYDATTVNLRADHELLRNLLIHVSGGYERDAYKQATRKDDLYTANAGLDFKLSRRWEATGEYTYLNRTSSGAPLGTEFNEHRLLFMVSYRI